MLPSKPEEHLALERGHARPNLQNLHILLQMLKMQAIEVLVRKAFIRTTTQTSIRAIRRKRSRSQQGEQRGSLRLSSRGEAGDKVGR
jgi:hypothetical protein